MSRKFLHSSGIVLLVAAFVLHTDLWWWNDATPVLGLPIGMFFHVALCFASSAIFALLIRTGPLAESDADTEGPS